MTIILNNIRNLVTRTFYRNQQPMRQAHLDIRPETIKLIRKLRRSRNTNVRTYFRKYTPQELSVLNEDQINAIIYGLEHDNPRVHTYFQHHPKELSDLNSNQMDEIATALESTKQNVIDYFQHRTPKELSVLNEDQINAIIYGLKDDNPRVHTYFQRHTPKDLSNLDFYEIVGVHRGLAHTNSNVHTYFQCHTPKDLSNLNSSQMREITYALGHENERVVNYFKQSHPEVLRDYNREQIYEIVNVLLGRNPQLLTQMLAEKETATQNYLSNRPEGITEGQMLQNIDGLYAPMINHVIEYSQKGIDELKIPAEKVYGERFDKRRYYERIEYSPRAIKELNVPKEEVYGQIFDKKMFNQVLGQKYASAALKQIMTKFSMPELAAEVGSFLNLSDAGNVAQTNRSASKSAREAKQANFNFPVNE